MDLYELFKSHRNAKIGGGYDPKRILFHQLNILMRNDLITEKDGEEIDDWFGSHPEFKENIYCKENVRGRIPFIICPNPANYTTYEALVKAVDLGDQKRNTLFLDSKKITDTCSPKKNNFTASIVCGIETGIMAKNDLLKGKTLAKADDFFLKGIETTGSQQKSERIFFYEALMLLIYYPEILDVWDGIQAAGSYYESDNKRQSLRLYWLNDRPWRFLKIAKEESPIFDKRFVAPKVGERFTF